MADGATTSDDTRREDSLDGALRNARGPTPAQGEDEGELLAAVEGRLFSRTEPPRTLGRYRIIEELGSGGMGVVYRAHDPRLDRPVALKLLHRRAARSRSARERLRQEALALAEISHPNVVQIYDVELHADSIYIGMELVPGVDLGRWLEQPRPWREVVDLFIEAGRGLIAAHEVGLVHRDFKPSNVLLGEDGRPRVVDFGLARTTDAASTVDNDGNGDGEGDRNGTNTSSGRRPSLTRTGVAMGTPAYMAPEQHLGKPADARSDQYAFCLSVWEGIFGERPFRGRSIQELAASKESQGPTPPTHTPVPRAIIRALQRGMHAERSRRWPDLSTLLDTLTAATRPTGRSRWVGAVAIVALGGTAAGAWAMTRPTSEGGGACPPAEERLADAWGPERRAALRAAVESSELGYADQTWPRLDERLSRYTQQWQRAYEDACAGMREPVADARALDQRMVCLADRRQELASLTEVLAAGEGKTMQHAVLAVSELRPVSSCDDPGQAMPLDDAQRVAADEIRRDLLKAEALSKVARFDEGLALATPALERAMELELPALRAEALAVAGRMHKGKGEAERAQELLAEAALLATSERRDEVAARAAIDLVDVHGAWRSRYEDALEWNRHAEAAIDRLDDDPRLEALRLSALGTLELTLGHTDRSQEAFEQSLVLVREAHGAGHPLVAKTQSDLSNVLVRGGRFDEGLTAARLALSAGQQAFGEEHPQVGIMHSRLAVAWIRQGNYDAAAEHSRTSIDILADSLGRDHPNVASIMIILAQIEQRRGRLDEAAATYERSLPLVAKMPNEAIVLAAMADLARDRGDYEATLEYAQRSRELRETLFGPSDVRTAAGLAQEAEALARLGRDEGAMASFERARAIEQEHPLPAPIAVALTAFEGRAHLYAGRLDPAIDLLRAALAEQERLGAEPIDRSEVRFYLVQALWARGDRDDARAQLTTVEQELATLGPRGEHRRAPVREFIEREGIEPSP